MSSERQKIFERVAEEDLTYGTWSDCNEFSSPVYLSSSNPGKHMRVADLKNVLRQYDIPLGSHDLKADLVAKLQNNLSPHSTSIQDIRRRKWNTQSHLEDDKNPFLTPAKTKKNFFEEKRASPKKLHHVKFYLLRYRRFFFTIGVFTGILIAMLFQPFPDFKEIATQSLGNVGNFFPKIDLMSLDDEFEPGYELVRTMNLKAKHPVVLVPGIVSTGLEVWNAPFDSEDISIPFERNKTNADTDTNNLKVGKECAAKYFRKRLWGTLNQFRAVLMDRDCWLAHMMLDPETGLDPAGVRLRAAQGLEAADYLYPGYWVWAKVISNLATLGYDSTTMHFASYDWRLTPQNTEKRDLYFTRLKTVIELLVKQANGEKVVIIAHSMGSNFFLYFMSWIRQNFNEEWIDSHLHRFVNVAGPMLGVPKSVSSYLSGEMRDTAQMNRLATYIVDMFFSRQERAQLFRSWLGSATMLPKGGTLIWGGNGQSAPDDFTSEIPANLTKDSSTGISSSTSLNSFLGVKAYVQPDCPFGTSLLPSLPEFNTFFAETVNEADGASFQLSMEQLAALQAANKSASSFEKLRKLFQGNFVEALSKSEINPLGTYNNSQSSDSEQGLLRNVSPCIANVTRKSPTCEIQLDVASTITLLENVTGTFFRKHLTTTFSHGVALTAEEVKANRRKPEKWGNPLEIDLPRVKNSKFKIVCIYGTGKITERGYHYKAWNREMPNATKRPQWSTYIQSGSDKSKALHFNEDTEFAIDTDYTDVASRVLNGIVAGDGDGTVPLVSLGYMCQKGWKIPRYNPSGIPIVTREYQDQTSDTTMTLRGGENSGDHVDIMGNYGLLKDILLIVSGRDSDMDDRIKSRIGEISEKVKLS